MTKQKLEGIFSRSMKQYDFIYGFKLHNNPLAHQRTPADFIVHLKDGTTCYVECKECKFVDNKGTFAFSRLTQKADLLVLQNFSRFIQSYVLISFQEKTFKKSHYFMIPFFVYVFYSDLIGKKSMNYDDTLKYFYKFELDKLKGSILDLNFFDTDGSGNHE